MSSFIAVFLFFTTAVTGPAVTGLLEDLVGSTVVYLLTGLDWGALILGTEPC
jgi:hypothetical protein